MKKISLILFLIFVLGVMPCFSGQWRGDGDDETILGSTTVSDIDYEAYNEIVNPLDRVLSGHRQNMALVYNSAASIDVSTGQVVVSNATGTARLMLNTTATTNVTWADIDTGTEAASTTYYVYAIAASAASETATFKISTNSSAPTGVTYYKKLGSFYNNSSSNIERYKIYQEPYGVVPADSDGKPPVTAFFDYASSNSSFTSKTHDLKFANGVYSVAANSQFTITNLPFTSGSTYVCVGNYGNSSSATLSESIATTRNSGSSAEFTNGESTTQSIAWMCMGY